MARETARGVARGATAAPREVGEGLGARGWVGRKLKVPATYWSVAWAKAEFRAAWQSTLLDGAVVGFKEGVREERDKWECSFDYDSLVTILGAAVVEEYLLPLAHGEGGAVHNEKELMEETPPAMDESVESGEDDGSEEDRGQAELGGGGRGRGRRRGRGRGSRGRGISQRGPGRPPGRGGGRIRARVRTSIRQPLESEDEVSGVSGSSSDEEDLLQDSSDGVHGDIDPRAVRWRGGEHDVMSWLEPERFVGHVGPAIQDLPSKNPLQLLLLFNSLTFWNHAIVQTNLYATEQRPSDPDGGRQWLPVTHQELLR
eukprot:jgi/Chlat1/7179/Chrsp57S06835